MKVQLFLKTYFLASFLLIIHGNAGAVSINTKNIDKNIDPFNTINRHYLISISNFQKSSYINGAEFCTSIAKGITAILQTRPYTTCSVHTKKENLDHIVELKNKEREKYDNKSPGFKYHFNITQTSSNNFNLKIINLKKRSEVDFTKSDYNIKLKNKNKGELLGNILKILKRPLHYDLNNKAIKTKLTLASIAIDKNLDLDPSGMVVNKKEGTIVNITQYYKQMQQEPRKKEYLMAGLQIAAIFSSATAQYYISGENVIDWDFEADQVFSSKRLRFDNNARSINWGHAFAGAAYYQTIKGLGFTRLESFIGTFVTSLVWEFGAEIFEVVSIGDQVLTGIGGAIIGEIGSHARSLLNSNHGKNKWVSHILSMFLSPIEHLNSYRRGELKSHILDPREITKIRFFTDLGTINGDPKASLGLDMEYVELPIKGAGKAKGIYWDTVLSQVNIKSTLGKKGLEEVHFMTKAVLAAFFKKNTTLDDAQKLNGYSFIVGISSGAEYRSRDYNQNEDWMATVNVVGATLDISYFYKGIKIRASLDVFPDFVLARTYALNKYKSIHGDLSGVIPDVVETQGYQYGFGHTSRAKLSIENGGFEAGIQMEQKSITGIHGQSRYHDQVTNNLESSETQYGVKVYFSYAPKSFKGLRLGVEAEAVSRKGTLFSELDKLFAEDSSIDYTAMFRIQYDYM